MSRSITGDRRQVDVWAAEDARRTAMLAGDIAMLDLLLSDSLIYTHSTGVKDSKKSWLAKLSSGVLLYEALEFIDPVFILSDATVLIAAQMNATVVRGGQRNDLASVYLAVWIKQSVGWRLAAVQGTPLPVASPKMAGTATLTPLQS